MCGPADFPYNGVGASVKCDKIVNTTSFQTPQDIPAIKNTLNQVILSAEDQKVLRQKNETIIILDVSKSTKSIKSIVVSPYGTIANQLDFPELLEIANSISF